MKSPLYSLWLAPDIVKVNVSPTGTPCEIAAVACVLYPSSTVSEDVIEDIENFVLTESPTAKSLASANVNVLAVASGGK